MMKDPVFSLITPTGIYLLPIDLLIPDKDACSLIHFQKALREQEAIIQRYVKKLMEQLTLRSSEGPQDVIRWFTFTTYDLIRGLLFGEQFGCVEDGEYDPFVQLIRNISKELTMIQMFNITASWERAQRVIATVDRRAKSKTNGKDFLHYILAAMETDKGIDGFNTFSLRIAGSESSATLLCGFIFYTLTHPTVRQKLITEVRDAFQSEDQIVMANVHHLTYLNAVLQECLRIYPPVAVTLPRVVPDGGEMIDGGYVAAGTTVGVNHFACYHDQRNFHRPNQFLPERWIPSAEDKTSPFSHDQRNCLQPFSLGPRNCLGKNLAWAEIRLITTHLLYLFDREPERSVGNRWTERQNVFGFWDKPPLLVHLTPKQKTST
ncbi:benzoate 4-monooxygenase cytochrome P450, putative [Talaromyces stipitatus ATCC 10500]|uniref:Benzoate 4-monooxygenase cytochrome P450, putative n=2 Tax=Talaromyces stipitatus TaxID=28564 RepID=B8MFY6_TALSN|nr:benzoate 4-monooxygenase cytochrome P450, putative [Talaromyces stipitatus ATCC 10500]AWS21690.1 P450 decarboxylase [Talaromyces stipitatus]EED15853.1 benzoate 4-monooxygenase cytochrome P450, putative [Talaromyces stipitatus ATCC 10500]